MNRITGTAARTATGIVALARNVISGIQVYRSYGSANNGGEDGAGNAVAIDSSPNNGRGGARTTAGTRALLAMTSVLILSGANDKRPFRELHFATGPRLCVLVLKCG